MAAAGARDLTPEELRRYSRHLSMPEVGVEGQRAIARARVLLVGAGGLGSPAALYLAAAGVGALGLVDADAVDVTNLQRQVLYSTADVGVAKVRAAAERLRALNPHVAVEPHELRLSAENALELIDRYDVIVDGSDNFPTRYLVNDACVMRGKPDVYGSVFRFEGQVSVFDARSGPCYRCLFPEPPPPELAPNCAEAGVLGVLPGLIGMLQAIEVIKMILGRGDTLVGRLLLVDALSLRFRDLTLRRSDACPACGPRRTITRLIAYEESCNGADAAQADDDLSIAPRTLDEAMRAGRAVRLVDVREPFEFQIARLPNAELIPLLQLPRHLADLQTAGEIVVYCHHGLRSAEAQAFLRARGCARVRNLTGGIDRWAVEVDPAMPRY
jgi:adenylyltransferase/sulfurtransferase